VNGEVHFDYSGKVIAITGGGTGIGRGIGAAFLRAGGSVVVTGRRAAPLESFCALDPERASFIQMDVGIDEDRRRTIDTIIARHGRLDVLINNALAVYMRPLDELEAKHIEKMYRVLLVGPTALTQAAIPHLAATQGNVINISSVAARHVPFPAHGLAVYSAAKAGLNQLTRVLASELAARGVRVNAIAPGATRTEETSPAAIAAREASAKLTPMGRVGEPEDIAAVALFLASEAAAWVTGQVIDASGGFGVSG